MKTATNRVWKGASLDERRAERREQFVAAAIEVYGERGYRNATVRSVCEAAGLTERYFYESFENSETLLAAGLEAVMRRLGEEVWRAAEDEPDPSRRLIAMLESYFASLRNHPAAARVFLVEVQGVGLIVDAVFRRETQAFARLLREQSDGGATPADDLVGQGALGAVMHIALAWIASGYAEALSHVVATAQRFCLVTTNLCDVPVADQGA